MKESQLHKSIFLFISILSVVSSLVTLWQGIGMQRAAWMVLSLCLLVVGVWSCRKYRKYPHLHSFTYFECATTEDIDAIVSLDKRVFSENDVIEAETFKGWQGKNKYAFTVMCCNTGGRRKIEGYYSILPLKDKAIQALLDGHLRNSDIRPDDIYSNAQMRWCKKLYFFSIAVNRKHTRMSIALVQDAVATLEKLKDKGQTDKLYAMAATDDGEDLLRRFKFQLIKKKEEMADEHPLYVKRIREIGDLIEYSRSLNKFGSG